MPLTQPKKFEATELMQPNLHQFGQPHARGNLLGIAPYMIPPDYASHESFFHKLNFYLQIAQCEAWLNKKTIVLFPEYIGTWLAFANENEKIFQVSTLAAAERELIFRHLFELGAYYLKSTEQGRAEAAFFRMKAIQMAAIYHNVFSQLARDYSITLIAGSIVLPGPQIVDGRLLPSEGPLRNVSMIYQPDGTLAAPLIYKAFPTSAELSFTAPASAADLPAFETPAGRLGVLICADSWYPQSYAALQAQAVELLVVPSFDILGSEYWQRPWPGYDGWAPPSDVDLQDIKKITEAQAWKKYSLAGRISASRAKYGMNIFLRGKLWDMDLGGKSATVVRASEVFIEEPTQQTAMFNVWL